MNKTSKYSCYFNAKTIVLLLSVLSVLFIIGNRFLFPTYTKQVAVYFIDNVPKHTRRGVGGVRELSSASWSAHILVDGKNVVCDIPSSLYMMLKNSTDNARFAVLYYRHAIFSDALVCERLDAPNN